MKSAARIGWTEAGRESLAALLSKANGRRTTRVLSAQDVEACAADALVSELGFAWRNAGEGSDARALTTICLCVAKASSITIGVAAAHGAANPSSGWPDLPSWDRYHDASNGPLCLAWAGRKRDDRVSFELSRADQHGASRDELLARILASPADDGPRLVYADFLAEQGDPRGEFIQVQCELARGSERRVELELRERALMVEHGAQWLGALGPDAAQVQFERGFAHAVTLLDAHALAEVSAFLAHEPAQSLIVASPRLLDAARFGALEWVDRLRALEFRTARGPGSLSTEQLGRLLESRRLRRLERLSLWGQRVGDAGARTLVEQGASTLPSLRALAIEGDELTRETTKVMGASRWAGALTELSLADNRLGAEGVVPLADSRSVSRLASLSLGGNQLGNDGAFVIARAARFKTLRHLSLPKNRIGISGLEALLGSEVLRSLETLDLGSNPIGASGRDRLRARFG